MIKTLILLFAIISIVLYMVFAFIFWDIAWVVNYEWYVRFFYTLVSVLISFAILVDMSETK
jgi:hypothetical protein|nr:MAG TPA: hypothetical protein [Caudoviricetes sp.]